MKRRLLCLLFVLALVFGSLLAGCATTAVSNPSSGMPEREQAYLASYFGIEGFDTVVTQDAYRNALGAIVDELPDATETFGPLDAVRQAVQAAGLEELALTYTTEKARVNLAVVGLDSDSAYLACAVDAGLLDTGQAASVLASDTVSPDLAETLLMRVASDIGSGRRYLGFSNDRDILARLANAFSSFRVFTDPVLDEVGAKSVQQSITTGYSLKMTTMNARFLPDLTLLYGHSELQHAKQLVALLTSEGIVARLQLEPKVSIYQYMLDWGPIPEPSPQYYVEKYSEDLYLVHAVEYDLAIEFSSQEDLLRFNAIIEQYAKKYDSNQKEGSSWPLIAGAWWQPLYSASFDPDSSAYRKVFNCKVAHDGYEIQSYVLPEHKDALVDALSDLSTLPVSVEDRYVDTAFYRYLTGEDYQ